MVLLADATLAGTRDPDTPDHKYVEFGKQFPFVRRIRVNDEAAAKKGEVVYWYGSAVLIQPHWMVTAAHVVENGGKPVILDEDTKAEYPIAWFLVHPDFKSNNHGYCDIALGYSEKDFGLNFYPGLYKNSDEVDKLVTIAGFGVIGTFHTGLRESDGKRRAGSNKDRKSTRLNSSHT